MYQIGDMIEVRMQPTYQGRYEFWNGLIGEVVEKLSGNLYRLRIETEVPNSPHSDPHRLQLNSSDFVPYTHKEPDWII